MRRLHETGRSLSTSSCPYEQLAAHGFEMPEIAQSASDVDENRER
jgi:hypothetical protein